MTGHDFGMVNWRQYCKHSFRAGHAYAEIAALYKDTGDPLWSGAARANILKGGIFLLSPAVAILAALLFHSWIFIALPLLILVLLIARTAHKAQGKSSSWGTLILFGIHSQVQQIPIFMGQMRYWLNAKRHLHTELIEYK
jgi:hypothetical protein